MRRSRFPKWADNHDTSPAGIKCELVIPITFTLEASFYDKMYSLEVYSCGRPWNRSGVFGRWLCQGASTYCSYNTERFVMLCARRDSSEKRSSIPMYDEQVRLMITNTKQLREGYKLGF